jgi:hypothetical protein
MGDQDERGLMLFGCIQQQGHNLGPGGLIKVACRLISQENAGAGDNRPGNGNALLFTAGKLIREMIKPVVKPDISQRGTGLVKGLTITIQLQRDGDIFKRGHGRDQPECLKDDADMITPHPGQTVFIHAGQILPCDDDITARNRLQPGHHHHGGGFAGTARPQHGDSLTGLDLKADIVQDGDHARPAGH